MSPYTQPARLTGTTLREYSAEATTLLPTFPYDSNPINRAPIVTLVQSAIEVTPTTLGHTGP